MVVTAGNVQDRDGAKLLLQALIDRIIGWFRFQLFWTDGGYHGGLIDWDKRKFGWTLQIVEKLGDQVGFQVMPKGWIVERTFSWLIRQLRLGKDYERLPETSEAFI